MGRKRILFFAHAVTMAHFTRPLRWIECLEPGEFEIFLASSADYSAMLPSGKVSFLKIEGIDPARFAKIVERAEPIYDLKTFELHIEEDLRVIDSLKPDLIIGDFRHSLSVSARLRKTKYVNITDAYWSPEIVLRFPMPETPLVRRLGKRAFDLLIAPFAPLVLRFNFFLLAWMLRKSLKRVGLWITDYRRVITDGDVTVFCETPALVPLKKKLPREIFVGPITWAAKAPLPAWWHGLNPEKRKVFVSLGSSGDISVVPMIIRALSKLDIEIVVATAGKKTDLPEFPNVFVADFLPIDVIFPQCSVVICNGGSPMCHSAIAFGNDLAILGIISNNDQVLNMAHLEEKNLGIMLRYWNLTEGVLAESVERLLKENKFRLACAEVKKDFMRIDLETTLGRLTRELTRE